MSNKFSNSTQLLKRPKVCKPPPPPPAADITCDIDPKMQEAEVGSDALVAIQALNTSLPIGDPTEMFVVPEFSDVIENVPPVNDDEFTGDLRLENLEFEETETIQVRIVFSDGSQCLTSYQITWVEG